MPTLRLRFPAGRYHATPSGHHVNEGLIEWPPSPWRVLRALIACGFTTKRWREIPPIAERLLEKLAGTLPSYKLPETSCAHSRHFMPIGLLEKGREKTTLVFDTWANIGDGELMIHWDCELADDETQELRELAESLGYLGRSKSWVEAELIADGAIQSTDYTSFPHREGVHPGQQWEQIALMAAIRPNEYATWRREMTEKVLADFTLPDGEKKPSAKLLKDRARVAAPYPENLLLCLTKDTAWWKQHHWSQAPGSQRVLYWRRSDALQVGIPENTRQPVVKPVAMMLLSLTTQSGNRLALPPCRRTLPQAELFHRAIVGRVGYGRRIHCPELTGRDQEGRPLRDHYHARILPVDLDRDGHLDHLIIHAKMGLGEAAQRAIRTLRRMWTKGGVGDLQLALVGHGELNILRALPEPLDKCVDQLLGPPNGACVWESATPFVPPRFLKRRGRNTLLGQINSELASRQLPPVERVDPLTSDSIARPLRHYVRRRAHGGAAPPIDVGFALRLVFAEPLHGPLTLGYASHFGLGMFHAANR